MSIAYNFIAAWQLFPEKGTYQYGQRPKSGLLQISINDDKKIITLQSSLVTLENLSVGTTYSVLANLKPQPYTDTTFATHIKINSVSSTSFEIGFTKSTENVLTIIHQIEPNGFLKITQQGKTKEDENYTNIEFYHKQMSVLPYSASVSGAVIKPTQDGVIRHKVLTAMEEQTNMQLDQIRQQVELLALQAQAIQKRKELSLIVYGAKLNFVPIIGQTYHLYENADESYNISMISPNEWGRATKNSFKHVAKVRLLADHTWQEEQL